MKLRRRTNKYYPFPAVLSCSHKGLSRNYKNYYNTSLFKLMAILNKGPEYDIDLDFEVAKHLGMNPTWNQLRSADVPFLVEAGTLHDKSILMVDGPVFSITKEGRQLAKKWLQECVNEAAIG